jgi:hypothetical protein
MKLSSEYIYIVQIIGHEADEEHIRNAEKSW